ncbi:helicase [Ktedonobacter sp. SOSP1-85]|uniref:ABC transporter ATP-binding protein n=1 Tax=Ktedonobacter sp. SOSP1-85 TaxID=2778367 RepID=UPI001914E910|nr:ABC transporter ATP-binding protein [Ktedonobacter sp. SOSP1-85]GHO81390.1 helicase [Ktedonobacter sp. SOSP1-85]
MYAYKKDYLPLLRTYLGAQWRSVLLMSLLLLISIGLQLANPQLLQIFIDAVLQGSAQSTLILTGVLFVVLALSTQGASIAATYLSENVAWTATNRLREDLISHCLTLDMSFHKAHTPGELIQRVDGDVDALASFFSQAIIQLVGNLILLLGIVLVLFQKDWRLGLMMLGFTTLAFALLALLQKYGRPFWLAYQVKYAEFFGQLGEHLEGTEEVRANGATSFVMRRFHQFARQWWQIDYRRSVAEFLQFAGTLTIFSLGNILALAVGAWLLGAHAISLGTVYEVFYYTNLIILPIKQIRNQIQDLQTADASIERIQNLLKTRSILTDARGPVQNTALPGTDTSQSYTLRERYQALPVGALEVAFEHITFGYNVDEPVLRDVNFHLPAGKVLGVLGRTGSGKTTLARLLLRFYDAQSGAIRLSGVPLQKIELEQVRRRMAMVTQDVQLFQGNVRDNLTFFKRHVPDAQINAVLNELGLGHWLQALPNGLGSELGVGGAGLSAGEAQLLAFARAFLENPDLVLLDEASSRLDPATEQVIERAIERLLHERTGIIIAHRLATVQRADYILILQHGQVLEFGPRAELLANPASHFSQLLANNLQVVLS